MDEWVKGMGLTSKLDIWAHRRYPFPIPSSPMIGSRWALSSMSLPIYIYIILFYMGDFSPFIILYYILNNILDPIKML